MDDFDFFNDNNNTQFMQPVMDSEININSIGNVKIWELVSIFLIVFLIILIILYTVLNTCVKNKDITSDNSESDDEDEEFIEPSSTSNNETEKLKQELLILSIKNLEYLNPNFKITYNDLTSTAKVDSFA